MQERDTPAIIGVGLFGGIPGIAFYLGRPKLAVIIIFLFGLAGVAVLKFGLPEVTLQFGFLIDYGQWFLALVAIVLGFLFQGHRRNDTFGSSWYGAILSSLILSGVLAILIRTLVFQPFLLPSDSMYPSIRAGDYVSANKYAYGYSRYSLPTSPNLFSGRIFAKEPEYGDIVVFKFPDNPQIDYLKRLVGKPGDTIQMSGGSVVLNDKVLNYRDVGSVELEGSSLSLQEEVMPNGTAYIVASARDDSIGDNTGVFVVPDGHYFMLGDNRDNSSDSRFNVGFVPFENLIGRVDNIIYNENGEPLGAARKYED